MPPRPHPGSAVRPLRILLAAGLTVLASGCAWLGGSGLPDVQGEYRGTVMVQGESLPAGLAITQDGSQLEVTLDAPALDLTAAGQGMLRSDGTARIVLAYDLQCPGEAELVGAFADDGSRFEGEVRATDCTGQIPGTFSFAR